MKVAVIGNGAREHTIASAVKKSPLVSEVVCIPGNDMMKLSGIATQLIDVLDFAGQIAYLKAHQFDYTIVGPEQPLVAGIVDAYQAAGLKAFGPSKAAAQIEGSKTFAKEVMTKANVPTAKYATYEAEKAALVAAAQHALPLVIKCDGLAAGKGVVIAKTVAEATNAIKQFFAAGVSQLLIEDYLVGEEFSLMALVADGEIYPLPVAQDHKRAFDGDRGPNTGGMGAYCPVPQIDQTLVQAALTDIIEPVVSTMAAQGTPFSGVLYAGLIATANGVKVIEFNARFGDPETQVVLPRLIGDWALVFQQLVHHEQPNLTWQHDGTTLGVVIASEGYPTQPSEEVSLGDFQKFAAVTSQVYGAGVKQQAGQLYSAGGRLYTVVTTAKDFTTARAKVYADVEQLAVPGTFYRTDIGQRSLNTQKIKK